MSQQLAASTVRPPSFGDRSLEEIAESRERPVDDETDALPSTPRHELADLRDLLAVAERRPGAVSLVDTVRHERIARIDGVGRGPHSIAFHRSLPENTREGAHAYVQSRQGWVSKIDLYGGRLVARVRGGTSGRSIAVSADSRYVCAGYYNPNHVVVFDADTLEPLTRIRTHGIDPEGESVPSRVCTVLDVPGQRCFLVALKDAGRVWFVDYGTDSGSDSFPVVDDVPVGPVLHDALFAPDERHCFLASQGEECLFVLDTERREVVDRIPTAGPPHPSPGAIDRDRGLGFAATVMTDAVTAWDLERWEPVADVEVPGDGMFLNSHPDCDAVWGDVIFDSGDRNELLYRIDPDTLEVADVIDTSEWGEGRSLHPEFTRDGDSVYVSLWDAGKLLVFDAESGDLRTEIDGLETPTGSFLGTRATDP
ncbi:nitrite reductase (NO-forming) / hydroxylamine reductase [Halobiforma haloterrestris]|uniref:Nitrite reductase (NO-forming) / hydroxylamine reductase n=1 Tax=Natronobacterium haloterrestre TaxID=148448 RepID=A0A1I1G6W4_NATHA|nr:cytochrome D1 domain-containing protein [Halobiforma haloterrestris]SFC07519.1 nitrite reductase (NO-forming) / hydroxylamine reductase [Halobiforma haloterrestris]